MMNKNTPVSLGYNNITERIGERLPVFLDTSVWINMVDGKTDVATEVKCRLQESATQGRLFCPLSAPLIWELCKQSFDSRMRTAALMESLSLNVCFARSDEIFESELFSYFFGAIGEPLPARYLNRLFVPVAAYLSSHPSLEFSEDIPAQIVEELSCATASKLDKLTLTEILQKRGDQGLDFLKHQAPPQYSAAIQRARVITKGDKAKAFRIASETVAKRIVFPAIDRFPLNLKPRLEQFLASLPVNKYKDCLDTILEQLPALRNFTEVMAVVQQDPNRKDRLNDFFDLEMIAVAMAYTSAFVAIDGRTEDILKNRFDKESRNKCRFLGSMSELEQWVATL